MATAALDCGSIPDRAERRRRQIIEAARKLFVEKGFHATGVAQIARESGVAVGQIYRDFAAKEDIVAAIVESDCTRFVDHTSLYHAIEAGDSQGVWAWLRQFLQPADHDSGGAAMFAEIASESTRNPRIADIFVRAREDADANMHAAFALLAPGAPVADRRARLADLVFTQSLGLKQYRLFRPDLDPVPMVEIILALIAREIDEMTGAKRSPA